MQVLLEKMNIELKIRNYSPKTIKLYAYYVKEYFLLQKQEWKYSPQTLNLVINARKGKEGRRIITDAGDVAYSDSSEKYG